jgi:protein SCO1/2
MLRSALLCAALALGGYAGAAWLTHDFQVWTAEGARRLEVALAPVPAPPVMAEGPGIAPQPLTQLLAAGPSVTVVDFVYTRCQTVCVALGSVFQQMQAQLQAAGAGDAAASRIKLMSISFDERDSTPDLQAYAARLQADPRIWRFVRVPGAKETQRLLADFQVTVVPDGRGDFEHNAALLVVDRQGRLIRVFDYAQQQLALDYARHLASGGAP